MKKMLLLTYLLISTNYVIASDTSSPIKKGDLDSLVNQILSERGGNIGYIKRWTGFSYEGDLPSQVSNLSIDQKINIPEWQWVSVIREVENQYSNGNSMIEVEDTCGIQKGGQLQVLGFSPDSKLALVEYLTEALGAPCRVGAMFFITVEELTTFNGRYEEISQKEIEKD